MVIDGWIDEPANTRYNANAGENSFFFGGAFVFLSSFFFVFFHISDSVFSSNFGPNRSVGRSLGRSVNRSVGESIARSLARSLSLGLLSTQMVDVDSSKQVQNSESNY